MARVFAHNNHTPTAERDTTLCSLRCNNIARAASMFGSFGPRGEIPLILMPSRGLSPFLTIPEGMHALVTRHGRYIGIWPSGFHFAPPWVQVQYLVTKQAIVFDTPVKNCPTQDNVQVQIDISIVFKIMDDPAKVEAFAYSLGASSLEDQLAAAQEEAVRALARSVTHDQVYLLRSVNTDTMKKSLNNQFQKLGVEILDVLITNVHLPGDIAVRMQDKTTYQSKNMLQQKKQAYELLVLNNTQETQRLLQEKEQERMSEKEKFKKVLAEVTRAHEQTKAETKKQIAELQERQRAEVLRIHAESDLLVTRLEGEQKGAMSAIMARGRAEASALAADKDAFVRKKQAEIDSVMARRRARIQTIEAQTQGESARMLAARREYEVAMAKLKSLEALSQNPNLVVSGNTDHNILAALGAAQSAAKITGVVSPPVI